MPVRMRGGYITLRRSVPAHRLGIAPSYPQTLAALPPVQQLLKNESNDVWRGAQNLAADLFTLPTHSLLTSRDCFAIERLLSSNRGVV